jgi:hydroxymethylbilane synthase
VKRSTAASRAGADLQAAAIGTRGSRLALIQAGLAQDAIGGQRQSTRIVVVETDGDRRDPDTAWGEGAFVAELERALVAGRIDAAVHSVKDVPTDEDPRLVIAAYLPRADPRDALVLRPDSRARSLADLPPGSRVGTDSPRRTGFILGRRPDLRVHPLHGNVDSRLRRLDDGETDALTLACAGLDRMGLGHRICERLDPELVPPAPGQGAIAIQVRRDDERMLDVMGRIDDLPTRWAVEAERAFLRATGGGCRAPVGALARIVGDELDLLGGLASPDGSDTVVGRRRGRGRAAADLGRELAAALANVDRPRAAHSPSEAAVAANAVQRVLVTRAADQAGGLVAALEAVGVVPIPIPAIEVELVIPNEELDDAAWLLHTYRWVVITSPNGARALLKAAERVRTELGAPSWAAIGDATRDALERDGIEVDFVPSRSTGATMATELAVSPGDRVLVVRGDRAGAELTHQLRSRGAEVDDVVGYRTLEAPEASRERLRAAMDDERVAAAVFTSGSTVRGLMALGRAVGIDMSRVPAVCIGPETARRAEAEGFRVVAVAPAPDSATVAAATAQALGLPHPVAR